MTAEKLQYIYDLSKKTPFYVCSNDGVRTLIERIWELEEDKKHLLSVLQVMRERKVSEDDENEREAGWILG